MREYSETDIAKAKDLFKGNSKTQEQYAEYYFLKELILAAATQGKKLNIARSDFDAFGFDLLISEVTSNPILTIELQLKATSGKNNLWDVHKSLLNSKTGRVVLVDLSKNTEQPVFLLFDNKNRTVALKRSPKVNHTDKCKILKTEFRDITNNILSIF